MKRAHKWLLIAVVIVIAVVLYQKSKKAATTGSGTSTGPAGGDTFTDPLTGGPLVV